MRQAENISKDHNEQFTHQKVIRDEIKKTGPAETPADKRYLYAFILAILFATPFLLVIYAFILSKMWNMGDIVAKCVFTVAVLAFSFFVFFAARFVVHFFIVSVELLYSRLRHAQLIEGVGQWGDVVAKVNANGVPVHLSAQHEEAKLIVSHPRMEPIAKESSPEEKVQLYFGMGLSPYEISNITGMSLHEIEPEYLRIKALVNRNEREQPEEIEQYKEEYS